MVKVKSPGALAAHKAWVCVVQHRNRRWKKAAPGLPGLPGVLGSFDCWCGKGRGHDWPGKADGEPHPR